MGFSDVLALEKTKPRIPILRALRPEERTYTRPLTDEERAQAVVELGYRQRGKRVPLKTRLDWLFTSPEARKVTETILLPPISTLQAVRGISEAKEERPSILKIAIDSARRGLFEPEKTEPLSVSTMKAYPKLDWRTAGGIGTVAELSTIVPRLFTSTVESLVKMGKTQQAEAEVSIVFNRLKTAAVKQGNTISQAEEKAGTLLKELLSKERTIPPEIYSKIRGEAFRKTFGIAGEAGKAMLPNKDALINKILQIAPTMEKVSLSTMALPELQKIMRELENKDIFAETKRLNDIFIKDELRQKNARATKKATSLKKIESSIEAQEAFNKLKNMGYKLVDPMLSYLGFNIKGVKSKPLSAEDIELKPDKFKNWKIAIKDKSGKIYSSKYGENDIYNHYDLEERNSLKETDIENAGYINPKGEYVSQLETSPKKPPVISLKERLEKLPLLKDELAQLEEIRNAYIGKIRLYKKGFLKEELSGLPKVYISKIPTAQAVDEVMEELRNKGINIQNESELRDYFINLENRRKQLLSEINEIKPKVIGKREDTLLKEKEALAQRITQKTEKDLTKQFEKEVKEMAKTSQKIEQEFFEKGKRFMLEEKAKRYFGPILKEERQQITDHAYNKGLIYKDYTGKEHDKLRAILRKYPAATASQIMDYINALADNPQSPHLLFKLTGDISKDTDILKVISDQSKDWVDINGFEIYALDPARIVEKVTQRDLWDKNILADNTFNVISAADEAMFDRLSQEITELKEGAKGVKKGSKESAAIHSKFESGQELTEREKEVLNFIRKKYDHLITEANQVRVLMNKPPIPYRQDYITHIIETNLLTEFFQGDYDAIRNMPQSQLDAIRQGDYTKGNMPFNKFAQRRLGKETKFDIIGNYETYLKTILREIYYSPAIKHSRDFIRYAVARQPNAYKALDRLLNDLKGKKSIIDQNLIGAMASSRPIKFLRTRIAQNALIGNISFWAMNTSNFVISYDELGNYMNVGLSKFLFNKEWRDFAFKNSALLKGRSVDPDIDPGKFETLKSTVAYVTNLLEFNNVGSTFVGAYHKAVNDLGYDKEKAITYADTIARRTQAGYKKYEMPAWMRSNTGMFLSQFQTWSFNMMNHIIYDLKLGNIGKKKPVRWGAFWTLLTIAIFTSLLYKKLGLRMPYTPESAIPKIPFVTTSRYEEPAVVSVASNIKRAITSKRPETRKKAIVRTLTSLIPPFGGAQLGRFATGNILPTQTIKKKRGGGFGSVIKSKSGFGKT